MWLSCSMRHSLRFLWNATKGHRLAPWRSPYLLWRIETYCGVKMTQIGFLEFWEFLWRERVSLWRFLKVDRRDGTLCESQAEKTVVSRNPKRDQ